MFRKFSLLVLSLFLLIACNEAKEAETPAKDQIENYSKKLEDCKDDATKKTEEEKAKQQAEKVEVEKP